MIYLYGYIFAGFSIYWAAWGLYVGLIPYKDSSKGWPVIMRIPYALLFLVGFLLDLAFNVFYAVWFHMYYAIKSKHTFILKLFFPPFSEVKSFKTLYKISFTKRVQAVIDESFKYKAESNPLGRAAYKYAVKLNNEDPNHIDIPKGWGARI